jgi:hypothetical protein
MYVSWLKAALEWGRAKVSIVGEWAATMPDGTTTIFPEGPVSVLGGKGKFEGAKGDGTWSGTRLAPLATGADLYVDFVINVKK